MSENERGEASMDRQGDELTLEGLAQRLEALERENASLRHEVTALRDSGTGQAGELAPEFEGSVSAQHEVTALRDSDRSRRGEPASEFTGPASRRSPLRNAGAAALGAAAAGALGQRDIREAKATGIFGSLLRNAGAAALGVVAAEGLRQGLRIRSQRSNVTFFDYVRCNHLYAGFDVQPPLPALECALDSSTWPAFYAKNRGFGTAVEAYSQGTVLKATSTGFGYGGVFQGTAAPLLLQPNPSTGRPTSGWHYQGAIYLDQTGALFVCTASGDPGTWRRITTTAA